MTVNPKSFAYPLHMTATNERLFYGVGYLVAEWANLETLFFGIFWCVIGKDKDESAKIIWISTKSTAARLDLVYNTLRHADGIGGEQINNLASLMGRFHVITKKRNTLCHARYLGDPDTDNVTHIFSYSPSKGEDLAVKESMYEVDKAFFNELKHCIISTQDLALEVWDTLLEVRFALKARHVRLPSPLPEYMRSRASHQYLQIP